jgi:hypothetical protein
MVLTSFDPMDPASITASRFSFKQILLLLAYILLDSSLPARLGDTRQLRDIISRDRTQWNPQIGEEGFHEIKEIPWEACSPATRRYWEKIREYLLSERLVYSEVSSQDVRENLRNFLCRIEQISSQGLHALCTPRSALAVPKKQLGVRASLVLICLSVSVTSTPHESTLGTLLSHLNEEGIRKMASEIQQSPLFWFGIGPSHLWDTLWSLELRFSGEDDQDPGCSPGFRTSIHEQSWMVEVQHETRKWQYFSTQPIRRAQESPHDTGTKRRRRTMSTTGGICTRPSLKRQKRSSSDDHAYHSSTTMAV